MLYNIVSDRVKELVQTLLPGMYINKLVYSHILLVDLHVLCEFLIFSELYRSSSFNSSGRSSICDTPDDAYSDTSIEEDVIDLNNKVT